MTTTTKWIDLKDTTTNGRLKVTTMAGSDGRSRTYLFVVGLLPDSGRWKRAIELLGFSPSPNNKYLVRLVTPGERITAKVFAPVWPNATLAEMPRDQAFLDLKANKKTREEAPVRTAEEESIAAEVGEIIRLGRNCDGDEVYLSPLGRYIHRDSGNVYEDALLSKPLFLRAETAAEMSLCADGFVQSMILGEVQHSDDFERFLRALSDKEGPYEQGLKDRAQAAIEAATLRQLERLYDTAQDAYGDSARLYEFLPPFQGSARGKGAMPLPLSIMAQRLLGDTSDKQVVYPNAFDGASFAFLPQGTRIRAFRGIKDLSTIGSSRQDVEWSEKFDPAQEMAADAMFINSDPGNVGDGTRSDYSEVLSSLRILNAGGRAVIVLAAGEGEDPGEIGPVSRGFYDTISRRYQIEAAFEIPALMTDRVGTKTALRVLAIRNRTPSQDTPMLVELPVKFSWDEVKSYVDEAIITINLKEAETQSIDVERVALENDFQRPYIAFSKVGEARTMVPKNLQAPLQAALTHLEQTEGSIDRFVERELGYGENTLGQRFSPEQVDALGLSIARMKTGRAPILCDETGIGKGRILSGLATWAEKQGKNVIFITDRSNLFSDLARDMRDIDEWGRFKPLVMNADGVIMDVFTGAVLNEGTPASEMRSIVEGGRALEETGANLVLSTYSQISGEDSEKAAWLLNQAANSLVIIDESHIAAGSDSNMSRVVLDLATRSWACTYSSATWAKSSENLHVYARALPEAINIASLARTMKTGGEAFAEVFSGMLARDGAMIRREHDLSKLEFVVETDANHLDRNNKIADQVAEVLGAMTFVGGEINRLLMRSNNDTVNILKAARAARSAVVDSLQEVARGRRRARAAQAVEDAAEGVERIEPQLPADPLPVATGRLFRSSFGAGTVLYQVMRRLLALLNADNAAELSLKALAEGRKPVIVFEDTGESFVRKIFEEHTLPGIDGEKAIFPSEIPAPTIKDMLYKVVSRMGVVVESKVDEATYATREEVVDEEVDIDAVLNAVSSDSRAVVKVESLPGLSEEARKSYVEGMQRIVSMIDALPPMPLNAIDVVRARLQDAGLRVGEISGRRMMLEAPELVRSAPIDSDWNEAGKWTVVMRKKSKPELNKTVYAFNHGMLDVLMINRSAAAGLSLHASPRFSDRRRRELIEMQIPENPNDRIQLYGRVNRFDQVVGPKISNASTGVYGEMRQLMMQNKKLARLSANTRSSRENAAEIKYVVDLINPVGEEVCRRFLEDNGAIRQRLGISEDEMNSATFSAASKLTSRLVLLKVAEQKMVYEEIYEAFDEEIIRLDLAGENPLRAKEMDIRAKTVKDRIAIGVDMEGLGSAFDGPVHIKEISWKVNLRPMEWAPIVGLVKAGRDRLISANLAKLEPGREDLSAIEYAAVNAIDWEADVWRYGEDNNKAARAFLEAREKQAIELAVALPGKNAIASAIEQIGLESQAMGRVEAAGEIKPEIHAASLYQVKFDPEDIDVLTASYRESQEIFSNIDMSAMIDPLVKILDAKSRIELVGTKFVDLNDALSGEGDNAIKRAWSRKLWVEEKMSMLSPGSMISVFEERKSKRESRGNEAPLQVSGVVTSISAPPKGKESQLQRWKVEWIAPGDEKPRSTSLATLLEDVSMQSTVHIHANNIVDAQVELFGGPILHGFGFGGVGRGHDRVEDFKRGLEFFGRGVRERTGYILDGNMYLASEWAQATKNGFGVVYTDERGIRHRAVMLKNRLVATDIFNHLPVRLWNRSMLVSLVSKLCDPENEIRPNNDDKSYFLPTDFASAMGQGGNAGADRSRLLVYPGRGVAMTMERKDVARVSRALKSESRALLNDAHPFYKNYSTEEKAAANAELPKVTTSAKRGSKPIVMVEATTPEMIARAVGMLCKSIGLEVYVWPGTQIGTVASQVVADYFTERREAARLLRDSAANRIERPVVPDIRDVPMGEEAAGAGEFVQERRAA